ncbi:unnamed protein product [Effrenium voratum]|uniref:Uncharacterized protein n=1 Tax=Effrenium voratum TaxID=2562239 RepID=A0AA36ITP2_9DINO|nr:unnamed protein product [Effrenium voratum]CAJ1392689.1 unnamed protein product [Effrenium voratum]
MHQASKFQSFDDAYSFATRTAQMDPAEGLKPSIQELVLLLRKALRTVCEELRRIHKGNKSLEEQHRALAGQLADHELKQSLQAISVRSGSPRRPQCMQAMQAMQATQAEAVEKAAEKASVEMQTLVQAMPSVQARSSAQATVAPSMPMPSPVPDESKDSKDSPDRKSSGRQDRRLTLRLSKSLLRKLSSGCDINEDDESEDESGSEIFEANNPEEVQEMQKLLQRLCSRYDIASYGGTMIGDGRHSTASSKQRFEEEPETSPTSRASAASQSRRLAPGLEDSAADLPPRKLTIFQKR